MRKNRINFRFFCINWFLPNYPTPSNGKIIFNYTSVCEANLDAYLAAHPDYDWVKGKLITAPSSN